MATAATVQTEAQATQPTSMMSSITFGGVRIALMGAAIIMLIAALHPDVRSSVRGTFLKDYRQVVSTAQGHLAGDERLFTVTKVKTRDSLSLEIFEVTGEGQHKMVEKIVMPDSRDGYFAFAGQSTNLAIDDVDGDGKPEILAPTFDNNMVGRLNVYDFDASTKSFNKVIR